MKKYLFWLILSGISLAQTTSNFKFNIPATGTQIKTWGPLINANFICLDTLLVSGGVTNCPAGAPQPHLVAGTNITITGTWPNQTISSTGAGAITSVFGMTGIIANLSGDISTSGSSVATLPTVNGNVGSFTAANITVNAKGQVTAAANGSASPGNLTGPITSTGLATTVAPAGVVAQKPAYDARTFYAAPNCAGAVCSDSNDGLSWGTAKLTVMGAYAACVANRPFANEGCTIRFAPYTVANAVANAGIWLCGPYIAPGLGDPDCVDPLPSGWAKFIVPVKFEGVPSQLAGPNAHKPRAILNSGGNTDRNHPCVWITGVTGPVEFDDMACEYQGRPILLGETIAHLRNDTVQVVSITFNNVDGTAWNGAPGFGPGWDITGQTFWIWLNDCGASGTDDVVGNDPNADSSQAVLLDGKVSAGVFLIFINDINTNHGAIKTYRGGNVSTFYINGVTSEALSAPAVVWFATQPTRASVKNVENADPSNVTSVLVQNDGTGASDLISVESIDGLVKGPMHLVGGLSTYNTFDSYDPPSQQQTGFSGGRVFGQYDPLWRAFGPSPVRFANLALATPIITAGTGTITTGVAAPDATSNAITITATAPGTVLTRLYFQTFTPTVGDYYIGSFYAKTNVYNPTVGVLDINGVGNSVTTLKTCALPMAGGHDFWQKVTCVGKVATSAGSGSTFFYAQTDDTHDPISIYGQMFLRIPAGTMTDDEVWELVYALQAYGTNCAVGTICGLPGQTITEDIFQSLTPNGASKTCGQNSELITLSTGGTTTDSTANLLPANSIIEAVSARVTTTITTATNWALGDATTGARFAAANSTLTSGTTEVGAVHLTTGIASATTGMFQSAAAKLRITTTGTPGAGAIRVTVPYCTFVPPTS